MIGRVDAPKTREISSLVKRESQLNILSYIIIVALLATVGVLLFTLLAEVRMPELWLLRNQVFRTFTTGLMLMVILYMVDQHARLRAELLRIHAELDEAKREAVEAFERLAFSHRAAELMSSLTAENGLDLVLRESLVHFEADATAVVGDDLRMHARDDETVAAANRAVMQVALDTVRAGKPVSQGGDGETGYAIAVPLRIEGQLRSVVCIWRTSEPFAIDQLEGLQLLARIIEMSLENRLLLEGVRSQLQGTLEALASLVDLRQPEYSQHSSRVAEYAVSVGMVLGLTEQDLQDLRLASITHDVGMLEVPREILSASRPLSAEELMVIRKHPAASAKIVKAAHFNERVQQAVLAHHERLDGAGYPNALRGDQIPLLARVLTVCDAYSAMTAKRPYRKAMTPPEALRELKRGSGTAYDPAVVQALVRVTGGANIELDKLDDETKTLLEQVS